MTKPAPNGKSVFWHSRQNRTTLMSVTGGLFGAAWILLHSPRAAQILAPPALSADGLTSRSLRDIRKGYGKLERQEFVAVRQPIYQANLACQTGDYVVSVRRIHSTTFVFSNNPPYGVTLSNPEPLRISMQVMSTRTGKIPKIDHFNTDLTAIDNTGQRLKLLEAGREFTFPDGVGCLFQVSEPSRAATYLRSIEGVIHLSADDGLSAPSAPSGDGASPSVAPLPPRNEQSLPFKISNIPLPWKRHVFGLMGAAVLDANTARTMHLVSGAAMENKPVVLQGAQMELILQRLPRIAFQTALRPPQPNLLALTEDIGNTLHLNSPVPGSTVMREQSRSEQTQPLICALTPHIQANGRIQIGVRGTGPTGVPFAAGISLWDNEPALLIFPAARLFPNQETDTKLVLYLDLHLDNYPPETLFNGLLPKDWRAKKGEIGGALSGEITTEKGPFGLAKANLIVTRTNENGKTDDKPMHIQVGLDKIGKFALSNLAAGKYQVTLEDVKPYQSAVIAPVSMEDFLLQHMGIQNAKVDHKADDIEVKAGDRIVLAPWMYKNTK